MTEDGKITVDSVRERLKVRYINRQDRVYLDETDIGQIVRMGKRVGMSQKTVKTVFKSKIYWDGLRLNIEASSPGVVLDKVAKDIARHLKVKLKAVAFDTDVAEEEVYTGPKP